VEDRFGALLAPGVVDEQVEAAESLRRAADESLAEAFVADVAGEAHDLSPGVADQFGDFVRVGFLGLEVGEGDIGAFAGEGDRDRATDARVAARDERLAAGQSSAPDVAGLAVVGPRLHFRCEPRPWLRLHR